MINRLRWELYLTRVLEAPLKFTVDTIAGVGCWINYGHMINKQYQHRASKEETDIVIHGPVR